MKNQIQIGILMSLVVALTTQCTFRRPTTQTVAPSGTQDARTKVAKTFFVGKDKSGRQKRFLFGMAPERELGVIAEWLNTHGVPSFEHSNIEFRVTEKYLIGLKVNPSYPDDSTRWSELIKIPIVSHYYEEKRKDANGRDTNEIIENTERSHWSARPYMHLDLSAIKIVNRFAQYMTGGAAAQMGNLGEASISDIEFVPRDGFLGFSMRTDGGLSPVNQAIFRVNLLAFEHNPNFQKTPFHEQNYKYINVLHVIGQKTETQNQMLFAAHWDLRKQRKVLLTGFPKEYEHLGIATVETWNKTLQDIGAVHRDWKPFVPVIQELAHPFDMRYVTLHWVQDIRISLSSPLGVGVATADVNNGEILWGKVTVYGGYIEDYLKAHTPTAGTGGSLASTVRARFSDALFNLAGLNKILMPPPQVQGLNAVGSEILAMVHSDRTIEMHTQKINEALKKTNDRMAKVKDGTAGQLSPDQVRMLYTGMKQSLDQLQSERNQSIALKELNTAIGMDRLLTRMSENREEDPLAPQMARLNEKQKFDFLANRFSRHDCADRTFADVVGGWSAAMRDGASADMQFMLDSIIYELLLHEMGHMIGLGHQFKENILPAHDAVPPKIYAQLKAQATPEAGYSNMTSVMGYRSPRTEIESYEHALRQGKTTAVEAIVPGEQDKLVLRFLYKQQYAAYAPGEADFKYFAVPQNGIIPRTIGKYRTSYFPQCNDGEASYGLDPYCNRFDRGPDAKSIVESYFDNLKDTMIQRMIAFGDNREIDAASAEYSLWVNSLRAFSRVRVFYDYMRAKMENDLPGETRRLLQNEEALYEFANACGKGGGTSRAAPMLKEMFRKSPQLKELCEVNRIAINEFAKILSLSMNDHAQIDFQNFFFPGGITGGEVNYDYSKVFGTWRELGALPMKMAALFALQSATPFVAFGPYIFPIPNYDVPQRRYAYVSLYPREFTEAQTTTVKSNLRFANVHAGESTLIGKSILYMGMLPHLIGQHNDSSRLPPQFMQRLRAQANFDIGYVAVLMAKAENQTDKYVAKKFNPTIYDLNTGKPANATEAYLMPEGEVIVKAENTFLVPISKFQFLDDTTGVVFAYRLTFYDDEEDVLNSVSPKTALKDLHDQTLDACLKGKDNEQNGLAMHFNPTNDDFKGFLMPPNISVDKEKQRQFKDSIRQAYQDYYANVAVKGGQKYAVAPTAATCQDAIQGLRMVVGTAAILNGYWLSFAGDYIQN